MSLPLSALIHAAAVAGLLIWLAQDRVARVEPVPLTVTLLPAEVSSDTGDPNAHAPPAPAGAAATIVTTQEASAEPEQGGLAIAPAKSDGTSARPLPEQTPSPELGRPPPLPIGALAQARHTIPPTPSDPPASAHPSKSAAQATLPALSGVESNSQPRSQAQMAAIEAAYLTKVRSAVEAARYYPRRARRLGDQGTVALHFEILPDGQIRQAQVQESSGSRTLDSAALHILERVGRFAPFPEELDRLSLAVRLPVDYHLDRQSSARGRIH